MYREICLDRNRQIDIFFKYSVGRLYPAFKVFSVLLKYNFKKLLQISSIKIVRK